MHIPRYVLVCARTNLEHMHVLTISKRALTQFQHTLFLTIIKIKKNNGKSDLRVVSPQIDVLFVST